MSWNFQGSAPTDIYMQVYIHMHRQTEHTAIKNKIILFKNWQCFGDGNSQRETMSKCWVHYFTLIEQKETQNLAFNSLNFFNNLFWSMVPRFQLLLSKQNNKNQSSLPRWSSAGWFWLCLLNIPHGPISHHWEDFSVMRNVHLRPQIHCEIVL